MNSTATERQRRYRQRRSELGDIRLHIWVNANCKAAIERLTNRMNLNQKEFIEKLISIADTSLSRTSDEPSMVVR